MLIVIFSILCWRHSIYIKWKDSRAKKIFPEWHKSLSAIGSCKQWVSASSKDATRVPSHESEADRRSLLSRVTQATPTSQRRRSSPLTTEQSNIDCAHQSETTQVNHQQMPPVLGQCCAVEVSIDSYVSVRNCCIQRHDYIRWQRLLPNRHWLIPLCVTDGCLLQAMVIRKNGSKGCYPSDSGGTTEVRR